MVLQPKAKKARTILPKEPIFMSPIHDLKIIVGGGGNTLNFQCLRFHYASVIKARSSFMAAKFMFDRTSEMMLVSLPEIDVGTWDRMMSFLDFPSRQEKMTIQDALSLAETYTKYGFSDGGDMCDKRILAYFQSMVLHEQDMTLDVDLFVEALLLARSANLKHAYEEGATYLKNKLLDKQVDFYGSLMFSRVHLEKLVPVIADQVALDPSFRCKFPFKTRESVESPMFSGYFLNYTIGNHALELLSESLSKITLSGNAGPTSADGVYLRSKSRREGETAMCFEREAHGSWKDVTMKFSVEFIKVRGWVVMARPYPSTDNDKGLVLWESPCSQTVIFPPRDCWKAVDSSAVGAMKIEYNFG